MMKSRGLSLKMARYTGELFTMVCLTDLACRSKQMELSTMGSGEPDRGRALAQRHTRLLRISTLVNGRTTTGKARGFSSLVRQETDMQVSSREALQMALASTTRKTVLYTQAI